MKPGGGLFPLTENEPVATGTKERTIMKSRFILSFVVAVFSLFCIAPGETALAQVKGDASPGVVKKDAAVNVAQIIRAVAAKETEFRQALNNYVFKRDALIQTIGFGGQITGEYHRISQFTFDDRGQRYEKINFFPAPTLRELTVSNEDIEDLGGIQPYALELSKIDQYNFTYVGKEHIDELDLYVFDVAPKVVPKKVSERFFKGRIWIDDHDLQIVKVKGKGVPEDKDQRFPTFDTYREQIDGRYWFPTYTYADEDLEFRNGQIVHIRMLVRYTEYRRFRSDVKIIEEDEPGVVPDEPSTPAKPKP